MSRWAGEHPNPTGAEAPALRPLLDLSPRVPSSGGPPVSFLIACDKLARCLPELCEPLGQMNPTRGGVTGTPTAATPGRLGGELGTCRLQRRLPWGRPRGAEPSASGVGRHVQDGGRAGADLGDTQRVAHTERCPPGGDRGIGVKRSEGCKGDSPAGKPGCLDSTPSLLPEKRLIHQHPAARRRVNKIWGCDSGRWSGGGAESRTTVCRR